MTDPVIYKYPLGFDGRCEMPVGAKIIDFEQQGQVLCAWAIVNPEAPMVQRDLHIVGTGHPIPESCGEYVATAHLPADGLVLHLFDGGEK